MSILVKFARKNDNARSPVYRSRGASGVDIRADIYNTLALPRGTRALVSTGITFVIPHGYEGQVRTYRNGEPYDGLVIAVGTLTLDSDSREELVIPIMNLSERTRFITPGDIIAQVVFAPVERAMLSEVTL